MYYNGEGVPPDYAEAAKWHRSAAEQGDADAQYTLGMMYDNGEGVPQSYRQAYIWFSVAAANGDAAKVKKLSGSRRQKAPLCQPSRRPTGSRTAAQRDSSCN